MEQRTIHAVVDFDLGLNPSAFSIYLRDDGELVAEKHDYFGAFQDFGECIRGLMHELAHTLVDAGWWR